MTHFEFEGLNSAQETERCACAEMLVETGEKRNIQLLFDYILQERSAFVRRSIIKLLGNSPNNSAVTQAVAELQSQEAVIRSAALEVLVLQGHRAEPYLVKLMKHDSKDIRKMAAEALGRIAGAVAEQALVDGLEDTEANVVIACVEALGAIKEPSSIPELRKVLCRTTDFWIAFAVFGVLAKHNAPSIMQIVDEYLDQRRWSLPETTALIQHWVAAAANHGSKESYSKALGMYAAHGMSAANLVELSYGYMKRGIPIEAGQQVLRSALPSEIEREIDIKAAYIASRYCPDALWNSIGALSDRYGAAADMREELATIFSDTQPDSDQLCHLLQTKNENVIRTLLLVAERSKVILPIAVLEELAAVQDLFIQQKVVMLAKECGAAARSLLQSMCEHSEQEIRLLAMDNMGLLEDKEPTESLLKSLIHTSEAVRIQAVKTLLTLGPELFAGCLYELFHQASDKAKPDVLKVAIGWNVPTVRNMLEEALAGEAADIRLKVARSCKAIDNEELCFFVTKLLANDPDEEVRRAGVINLANRKGADVYTYLAYLYQHDICRENRYFILNCDEIYETRHQEQTWCWLEENFSSADRLLQLAAVKGMSRLGLQGIQYLQAKLDGSECDEVAKEIILHYLKQDGGASDAVNS